MGRGREGAIGNEMLIVSLNLRKSYSLLLFYFLLILLGVDKVRRSSSLLYILINTRIYTYNINKVY